MNPVHSQAVRRPRVLLRACALGAAVLLACACTTSAPDVDRARLTFDEGRIEESLAQLRESIAERPRDPGLRLTYLTLRERGINDLLAQAARQTGEAAVGERARLYRRVLAIDPENSRARGGLAALERDARLAKDLLDAQLAIDSRDHALALTRLRALLREEPQHAKARAMLQAVLDKTTQPAVDPALTQALLKPMNIDFKDASLKQVFDVLARTADISFVLDRDIKLDQRVTLSVKNVPVRDAIDTVLITNQLEQRVQGRKTIVVYPNTPAKQKEYQPLKVRTFFLANADAEQMANTLKTVLKARDVVVDKAQNAVVLRDTAGAVQMAERLVALGDLPIAETMIEIEVLEVSRDRLSNLGVQFPPSAALTPLPLTSGGSLTVDDIRNLTLGRIGVSVGATTINASGQDADVKTLANPRIRVRNRETAKILIGDRVPNITSTATSTGFVSENVQYIDVGLKVEVTPTISVDNEVALKIALEVSSVVRQVTTPNGTNAYQIGTRSASTVLRLRDGENQVLAGLINERDNSTVNKVPGLGDLPVAGRLFSSDNRTKTSSEIVLSITPRLVRGIARPDPGLLEFESGTDGNLRSGDGEPASQASQAGQAGALSTVEPGVRAATGGRSDAATPGSSGSTDSSSAGADQGRREPTPAAAGGASIQWSAPARVATGGEFKADVVLNAGQPLTSMTLVLAYDPGALRVSGVSEGAALSGDGTMTTFSQRVDAATGQIFISAARPPGAPVAAAQGSGVSIGFVAGPNAGDTQLRVVSAALSGPDGAALPTALPAPRPIKLERAGK